jgi:hypothetical protein
MTEETENLALEHLRHIRARVDATAVDVQELKERLGAVEGDVGTIYGQTATLAAEYAILSNGLDRMDRRLTRIEGRLGLVEA